MRTPKAVWRQDSKYALFIIGLTLCLFGVPALIALFGFGQPTRQSLYIGFAAVALGSGLLFLFNWFRDRRLAGPVVVDLVPIPARWTAFLLGGMFILMGLLGSFWSAPLSPSDSWLGSSLIGQSLGIYQIFMGFSRVEIRENGIMVYIEFVPWDRIESLEWVEGDGAFSTLKIQYRTYFPVLIRKVDLPVPMEKRQQLESLLEGHVPGRASGEKRL